MIQYIICRTKYKKINVVSKSKYNNKHKKQLILLMIGDKNKKVKNIVTLL